MKAALCAPCIEMREQAIRVPCHLVHPEHGKRNTWDVRGEQACPECRTRWGMTWRNTF